MQFRQTCSLVLLKLVVGLAGLQVCRQRPYSPLLHGRDRLELLRLTSDPVPGCHDSEWCDIFRYLSARRVVMSGRRVVHSKIQALCRLLDRVALLSNHRETWELLP